VERPTTPSSPVPSSVEVRTSSLSSRSPLIVCPLVIPNTTTANHTGESYEFKRLDLSNEEDKAYFEGAMAWELTVDGKEWADGKNFK
jgi:hypothetical protein